MKRAGRKNDGAWFRTNKAIQKLSEAERANLAGSINVCATIDAAFNALVGLSASSGVTSASFPSEVSVWAQTMADNGIPRQVWFGRLSYTTYAKTNKGYVGTAQVEMMHFAKELRKVVDRFFMIRRQLKDLANTESREAGNPSGLPDTNKNT